MATAELPTQPINPAHTKYIQHQGLLEKFYRPGLSGQNPAGSIYPIIAVAVWEILEQVNINQIGQAEGWWADDYVGDDIFEDVIVPIKKVTKNVFHIGVATEPPPYFSQHVDEFTEKAYFLNQLGIKLIESNLQNIPPEKNPMRMKSHFHAHSFELALRQSSLAQAVGDQERKQYWNEEAYKNAAAAYELNVALDEDTVDIFFSSNKIIELRLRQLMDSLSDTLVNAKFYNDKHREVAKHEAPTDLIFKSIVKPHEISANDFSVPKEVLHFEVYRPALDNNDTYFTDSIESVDLLELTEFAMNLSRFFECRYYDFANSKQARSSNFMHDMEQLSNRTYSQIIRLLNASGELIYYDSGRKQLLGVDTKGADHQSLFHMIHYQRIARIAGRLHFLEHLSKKGHGIYQPDFVANVFKDEDGNNLDIIHSKPIHLVDMILRRLNLMNAFIKRQKQTGLENPFLSLGWSMVNSTLAESYIDAAATYVMQNDPNPYAVSGKYMAQAKQLLDGLLNELNITTPSEQFQFFQARLIKANQDLQSVLFEGLLPPLVFGPKLDKVKNTLIEGFQHDRVRTKQLTRKTRLARRKK